MIEAFTSLKNHFLIAMPNLNDTYFEKTVTFICEHNEEGAMGILINVPLGIKQSELFEHLEIDYNPHDESCTVFEGGPVEQSHGFVLHGTTSEQKWRSSLNLGGGISITTSEDILESIGQNKLDEAHFIALGYAGWDEGQIEQELAENSWLAVKAEPAIMFNTPVEKRWDAAMRLLGIDPSLISNFQGHA
jgi:putative transcriptional regulator